MPAPKIPATSQQCWHDNIRPIFPLSQTWQRGVCKCDKDGHLTTGQNRCIIPSWPIPHHKAIKAAQAHRQRQQPGSSNGAQDPKTQPQNKRRKRRLQPPARTHA